MPSLEYEPFEPTHMYTRKQFSVKRPSQTYTKKRKQGVPTEFDRYNSVFLANKMRKSELHNSHRSLLIKSNAERSFRRSRQRNSSATMSMSGRGKRPYSMNCKNGPGCKNHDWGKGSPVRLVCKNGPGCANHNWGNDRNPLSMKCYVDNQDCRHHNWDGYLTRHSIDMCDRQKKVKKIKKKIVTPQIVEPVRPPQPPSP